MIEIKKLKKVWEDGTSVSKRMEIKNLINEIKKVNPNVDMNIFKAMDNVNCDGVLTYKIGGIKHSFLDDYDKNM